MPDKIPDVKKQGKPRTHNPLVPTGPGLPMENGEPVFRMIVTETITWECTAKGKLTLADAKSIITKKLDETHKSVKDENGRVVDRKVVIHNILTGQP